MPLRRSERFVHCLVREDDEVGLVLRLLFDKFNRFVCQQIRCVAVEGLVLPVDIENGIVIDALSFKAQPVIKIGTRFGILTHVPFTNHCSFIADFLQILRKGRRYVWIVFRCLIVDHSMAVGVSTS